ncbi:MAG: enoyl-CoA hydratase, partial [Alphaproteobacteria bacterium]
MSYKHIRYEVSDKIARITTNRPQYRNAQSTIMLEELDDAFKIANFDPDVRVITLFGE